MEVSVSDRFSNLPEHMIHHILSFLDTEEVIRTGTLSKTFLSVSKSFVVMDFKYHHVRDTVSGNQFLNYVTTSIQKQRQRCFFQDGTVLQKFELWINHDDIPFPDDQFDAAISFAIQHSVKDLCLFGPDCRPPLPTIGFAKSLTELFLVKFDLKSFNELIRRCPLLRTLGLYYCSGVEHFKFSSSVIKTTELIGCKRLKRIEIGSPSLQSLSFTSRKQSISCENYFNCRSLKFLSLDGANLTDSGLDLLITQNGRLQTIKLFHCNELINFNVANHTCLKSITLKRCKRLESIEIGLINLEYFKYWGVQGREGSVSIDIGACKHLKHLKLAGAGIPKELLQGKISDQFLELEKLKLYLGWFYERVEINLQHLKSLSIITPRCADIQISAPRLVSFFYGGDFVPLYPIHHETTLDDARLGFFPPDVLDVSYFLDWLEFLLHLGPCKELTIASQRNETLIFPQERRKLFFAPLADIKNMIVELCESATITTELVDSLLWLSPYLETLVFTSFIKESDKTVLSIEFGYEMTTMNKEDILCLARPTESLSLKTVKIESFASVDDKDNLLKYFKGKAKSVNWK